MQLTHLRYLAGLVETGSITQTARVMGVGAPAVSKALQRLERDAGVPLLVPDGRGVAVTAAGKLLATRANRVLHEYAALEDAVALERDVRTTLRIASFEVFTTYFLGELVTTTLAEHDISIVSATPGAVESAVASTEADLGFTYVPVPADGVRHIELGAARMVVVGAANSAWTTGASLAELPFAVPAGGVANVVARQRNADGWPDDVARTVRYRVNAMETALELCRRGRAVAFVPAFVVELHNRRVAEDARLVEVEQGDVTASVEAYLVHRSDAVDLGLLHRVSSAAGTIIATG